MYDIIRINDNIIVVGQIQNTISTLNIFTDLGRKLANVFL